ncbi:carbonic anhydrase [Klebsormidium nitens]|uniref:carbonic anhydrase n=1 Tax=Klebsormidium nitens TaxID=105231 RepID=A0A1Y1I2R2_KLENI|nr:carbonic anhydrase [Klebsormidium nitens]|eukprot:GAQ83709.1 carbonic anhydrase [Klebsormidium nitens]
MARHSVQQSRVGGLLLPALVAALFFAGPVLGAEELAFNHTLGGVDWPYIPGLNASLCGTGTMQSPLNIIPGNTTTASTLTALNLSYATNVSLLNVTNEGDVVELVISSGNNSVKLPPSIYSTTNGSGLVLQQFHFHTPSEHMFDGIFYAAEMHFVHKDSVTGQQAVVAVLLKLDPTDTRNPDLDKFLPFTPNNYTGVQQAPANSTLNLTNLFPSNSSYWYYNGSLTTPPCTQNVLWLIFQNPLTFSVSQLLTLEVANAGGDGARADNRLVQLLNSRTVSVFRG